ncbi:hypothetical protein ACO1ZW_24060, partial [Enterobacter kobei]|uniref:hypothetical protein n=1 Tax=Enterobacter kobei TaxID=208224 RepID=UPI003BF81F00
MDFKCDELISEKTDADSRALTMFAWARFLPLTNLLLFSMLNSKLTVAVLVIGDLFLAVVCKVS